MRTKFVNQKDNVLYLLFFLLCLLSNWSMYFLYFLLLPKVMEKYIVPDYVNVQEFLAHLGKRLGKLKKGKVFLKGINELCDSGLCCSKADNTKPRNRRELTDEFEKLR